MEAAEGKALIERPDQAALCDGSPGKDAVIGYTTFDESQEEGDYRAIFAWCAEMDVGLGDLGPVLDCRLVPDSIAG